MSWLTFGVRRKKTAQSIFQRIILKPVNSLKVNPIEHYYWLAVGQQIGFNV